MRYGRLDRRIILQRRSSELTVSGEPVNAWSNIATRWASVGPVRGTEQFAIPQITAKELVEIGIRYSAQTADLHPGDRVVFPSSADPAAMPIAVYDILAVHEVGRREGQKIVAERQPVPVPERLIDPLTTNPFLFSLPRPPFLFQDAAGLIPVWATGQPVRRINELGPHGFIGLSPSDERRPTYRTDGVLHWLESDFDDCITFEFGSLAPQPRVRISAWRILSSPPDGFRRLFGGVHFDSPASRLELTALGVPPTGLQISAPSFAFPILNVGALVGRDIVITERFNGPQSFLGVDDLSVSVTADAGTDGSVRRTLFTERQDVGGSHSARYYGDVEWTHLPSAGVEVKVRAYIASLRGGTL
jgi:head-tail adaptor